MEVFVGAPLSDNLEGFSENIAHDLLPLQSESDGPRSHKCLGTLEALEMLDVEARQHGSSQCRCKSVTHGHPSWTLWSLMDK